MRVVEARVVGYSCGVQHNEVEPEETPASGVVAVHDELVRLVRQLVAGDRPPVGSPTFAQHSLLSFVARNPGCRATQISDAFGVHRSTVSRQLRGCIDEGWVHAEPGPLRSGHPLSLTDGGVAVLAGADARRVEEVRDRVASWSDGEIAAFARHLRKFRQGGDTDHDSIGDDTRA
ncbi:MULTISPECIES: MarR family winged helix-turn-helix transcriptional regulator [Rhodococcus]|uniref:MarR family transcriptional regulator n=1 Tax=Rhodococcus opacus M213 TaxID=1129896 RepID=K8XIJ8_RHOOP|nr:MULTISPECIES: MarR family winged helix-turn-helix transcriptional regulator [Rhodococcus]NDV05646.1 winged helix-turn-helix transcriptional regulator [Rhodococcus sp. IEGM 248]EKT81229.1 MarR family transcriptional regulator [Rhodococcus opacus M213]MDJ0413036.1 MarR family winged helix-turn-helix transcriptional regulator [Rhodococcus opacus]MDV7085193.1 MarR family winged helix-turn-helix transcriptional regulator [Rhodococcus opacus]UOT02560.1 MarR family winged helix-turn-helix transcri